MEQAKDPALTLSAVLGLSTDLQGCVVNLSPAGDGACRCAYASGHTGVLLDAESGTQTFLQGHRHAITAIAAPHDRSLLVTADAGEEPLMVLWDAASGVPLRTIAAPHAGGVAALAFAPDGIHLATLSAAGSNSDSGSGMQEDALVQAHMPLLSPHPQLAIWDVSCARDAGAQLEPAGVSEVPEGDAQLGIAFNPADGSELISHGRRRTYFWRMAPLPGGLTGGCGAVNVALSFYSPPLHAADFKQPIGDFVASAFVPGGLQALTSTQDGDVIVWDQQGSDAPAGTRGSDRRAIKVVRLHAAPIRHLSCVGDFVVTGADDGLVRFFDATLRLCAWFEELSVGPVACISFATAGTISLRAGMQMQRLAAPRCVIATRQGKLLELNPDAFNDGAAVVAGPPGVACPHGPGARLLLAAPGAALADAAAHPNRPEQLLLLEQGGQRLLRWDMRARRCLAACGLPPELGARVLVPARDGSFVALGGGGGAVLLLGGDALDELATLRHTRAAIARRADAALGRRLTCHEAAATQAAACAAKRVRARRHRLMRGYMRVPPYRLAIASHGRLVAAADESGHVLLYALLPHRASPLRWDLVGRVLAHRGAAVGLAFGEAPSGRTRLFSAGTDRRLLEYDLSAAATAHGAGLRVLSSLEVTPAGGTAGTAALCFAPPLPYFSATALDTLLLLSDDAYRLRVCNPDADAPGAPSGTYLGPTYGDPVSWLLPFRSATDSGACLAYACGSRVIGLAAWPPDGDLRGCMGVIAHPGDVRALSLTCDGRRLVTLGEQSELHVWDVDTSALHSDAAGDACAGSATVAASPALPCHWEQHVGDQELLQELADYFCYAQLTSDDAGGLCNDAMGTLRGRVPLSLLPDLMRAVGFYVSEADVAALNAHARFLSALAPPTGDGDCSGSGDDAECGAEVVDAALERQPSSVPAQHAAAKQCERQPAGSGSVDWQTLVCLFANHRPVSHTTQQQLDEAFSVLGAAPGTGSMPTQQLLDELCSGGEPLGEGELRSVLRELTGADEPAAALPACVDARTFACEVLGLAG